MLLFAFAPVMVVVVPAEIVLFPVPESDNTFNQSSFEPPVSMTQTAFVSLTLLTSALLDHVPIF